LALPNFKDYQNNRECSKRPPASPGKPVHAKTCLSSGKAAAIFACERTDEYVSTAKDRERRWRTLRLREDMLFQHSLKKSVKVSPTLPFFTTIFFKMEILPRLYQEF